MWPAGSSGSSWWPPPCAPRLAPTLCLTTLRNTLTLLKSCICVKLLCHCMYWSVWFDWALALQCSNRLTEGRLSDSTHGVHRMQAGSSQNLYSQRGLQLALDMFLLTLCMSTLPCSRHGQSTNHTLHRHLSTMCSWESPSCVCLWHFRRSTTRHKTPRERV